MPTDPLEAHIEEGIRVSERHSYHPLMFIRMRRQHGTVQAIERLVRSGEVQSGFRRLRSLNLLQWSIEQTILDFPERFTSEARECAEFRLRHINDKALRVK